MSTVLPLSSFCINISLFLSGIFNASNSTLCKFFSRILPVSLKNDEKAESPRPLTKVLPTLEASFLGHKWDRVFKSGPSTICRRQPLKNMKVYGLLKQTVSLQILLRLSSKF